MPLDARRVWKTRSEARLALLTWVEATMTCTATS